MTENEFRLLFDTNPKNLQYKRQIVEYLVDNGPETLPVLARFLGVSVPTISKMVGELVDHGLLRNFGKLEASTGRHPFLFGLTDKDFYFLGVDFSSEHISFVRVIRCTPRWISPLGLPIQRSASILFAMKSIIIWITK